LLEQAKVLRSEFFEGFHPGALLQMMMRLRQGGGSNCQAHQIDAGHRKPYDACCPTTVHCPSPFGL
jgi:hypothetical protein